MATEGTYDPVTVEEFDKYVARTFRGFLPGGVRKHRGRTGHQWHYDLWFNPEGTVGCRILSSITVGRESARDAGEGLIKAVPALFQLPKGELTETWGRRGPNLLRTFKRTKSREGAKKPQSWRNTLLAHVRKMLEAYYEMDEFWDWVGGGKQGPPPAKKDHQPYQERKEEVEVEPGVIQEVRVVVHKGYPASISKASKRPTKPSRSMTNGGWGIQLERGAVGQEGDEAISVTKAGRKFYEILVEKLGDSRYGEIWTTNPNPKPSKKASEMVVTAEDGAQPGLPFEKIDDPWKA